MSEMNNKIPGEETEEMKTPAATPEKTVTEEASAAADFVQSNFEEESMQKEMPVEESDESLEDDLIAKIDAFRDTAKQLQTLVNARKHKVKELDTMVRVKEQKKEQLAAEIAEKQVEADGLVGDVQYQVDRMLRKVSENMDGFQDSIAAQVDDNRKAHEQDVVILTESMEKVTSEMNETVSSSVEEISVKLDDTMKLMTEELSSAMDKMDLQISAVKTDLSDKIHKENVQSYRNIQELIKELDQRDEEIAELKKIDKKHTRQARIAILLAVLNLAAVCVLVAMINGWIVW